jgi:hypothetical protein
LVFNKKKKANHAPPPPLIRSNPFEVRFRDGGQRQTLEIHRDDWHLLIQAWRSGLSPYHAGTRKELTHKYPTSAIVALFDRWNRKDRAHE